MSKLDMCFFSSKMYEGMNKQPFPKNKVSSMDYQLNYYRRCFNMSTSMSNSTKHVVIVMDAMREFTTEPLEWALKNVVEVGCIVTLVGVMPWLNIPLSSKTELDVWPVELEEVCFTRDQKMDIRKGDIKYLKLQAVLDLCKNYGVLLQKRVVMGYPSRLLVAEQITSLHATMVVFDRHQKKKKNFYAERIPCNMVVMNEDGEVDMIRGCPMIDYVDDTTEDQKPLAASASLFPIPQLLISDRLKGYISQGKYNVLNKITIQPSLILNMDDLNRIDKKNYLFLDDRCFKHQSHELA